MKQTTVLLWAMMFVCLFSQHTNAQTTKQGFKLFDQANELMEKGDCENARKAIKLFIRAKQADKKLVTTCDKRIRKCQNIIQNSCSVALELTQDQVEIPWSGMESEIGVTASQGWVVDGVQNWFKTRQQSKSSFVVSALDQNNSTRERTATILVKSGSLYKSLKVIQQGRPEFIQVDASSLRFPPNGSVEPIRVQSNANWDVSSVPSWCKVEKNDTIIRIIVSPNDRSMERIDDIVVVSPNNSVTIKIYQGAGEEHLSISQNNIVLPAEGGKHYMKVYTDADNWFVGDFPNWISVQRVGQDSICIESGKNIPNGQERSGSVQVRTDRQATGIMVTQAARQPQDIIFHDTNIVGGRNLSLGVSASYYMPFVTTSAGGHYVASMVDYSIGDKRENASYTSQVGYSLGIFADMRIYKNIFLNVGANFTQIKYKNTFNLPTLYSFPHTAFQYMQGTVQNSYKESYTHTMLEVPVIASYRFKLNDVSHLQLNVGPVLNFGLSSKMKLSGNTDSDNMYIYDRYSNTKSSVTPYSYHTATTAEFDLYKQCVQWNEQYTTGTSVDVPHHDTFRESPLKRFNCGLRFGTAYEIAGLSFGLSYTMMLSNMANQGYWDDKRWAVLNESKTVMSGYKHRIHTLEFKIAYTLRYMGMNKSKNN